MREVASGDVVGPSRAARTPLVQWPASFPKPHEMIDDELKAPLEQVEQACFAVWTLEDIVLLDPDHRQPATLGVERVQAMGMFLLLGEQLQACSKPLGSRHDPRIFYIDHCHSESFFEWGCGANFFAPFLR